MPKSSSKACGSRIGTSFRSRPKKGLILGEWPDDFLNEEVDREKAEERKVRLSGREDGFVCRSLLAGDHPVAIACKLTTPELSLA